MTVKVGSAYGEMLLKYDQFVRGADLVEQRLQRLQQLAMRPITATVGAAGGGAVGAGGQSTALARLRDSEIRAARAAGEHERALFLVNNQLRGAEPNTVRYNNLLAQQAQVTRQAENAGQSLGQTLKGSILGVIGPAALLTAGVGLLVGALQRAEEGFRLNAQIEAATQSIQIQLRGVRDSNLALQQANAYATRYKLTQEEMTDAIAASIPVTRASKAPLDEILGVFDRLRIRQPGKTFGDAARALGELQAGQVVSLEKIFNVLPDDANRMSREIKGGADAVQVLSKYLAESGIGMDAVAARAKGASGILKDNAISAERLSRALGGQEGGTGVTIIQAKTNANNALANALSANASATYAAAKAYDQAYSDAIYRGVAADQAATEAEEARRATLARFTDVAAAVTAAMTVTTQATLEAAQAAAQHTTAIGDEINAAIQLAQLGQQTRAAQLSYADALEQTGVQARAAALAAEQKARADRVAAVDAQTHAIAEQALAVTAQEAALRLLHSGLAGANAAAQLASSSQDVDVLTAAYYRLAKARQAGTGVGAGAGVGGSAADTTKAAAADAAAARRAQILAIGTHNQKLLELNKILQEKIRQFGRGSAEAIEAETALIQERNSTAKAHTSELGKQLNLSESIYDSEQKRYRASIDFRLSEIADAKQDILDADKARRLRNTVANARDPRIRALAQLDLESLPLENAKREAEIAAQRATAGAPIINGRVYQSRAGEAGVPAPPVGAAAAPGAPLGVGSAPLGGGTATFILQAVLPDGRVLAEATKPFLWEDLIAAFVGSRGAGGGEVRL